MTIESLLAIAFWLIAWSIVLMRWRNRRIEADHAASLLALTSAGSLALYSLLRSELSALIVLVLVVWTLVGYAFGRYVLSVFADDRPGTGATTAAKGRGTGS